MRAAIGSQCKLMNRGVMCILFGSLKINLAAAFCINCRDLMGLAGRPAKRELQIVQSGQNKSLNKELCCMLREKGPDLLYIISCKYSIQNWAVLLM